MSLQRWTETLIVSQGDGNAITNSTVAATLLPPQAKLTFPANYFGDVGKAMRIRAAGRISNVTASPGTLTLDLRLGGTVVFNGGAMQLSTTVHTNVPWEWEVLLTQRVTGSSSTLMGQSRWFSQAANVSGADPTTSHSYVMAPNTAPAVGTAFDATAAQQFDFFGTFSVNTATTSILCHQFVVESLN